MSSNLLSGVVASTSGWLFGTRRFCIADSSFAMATSLTFPARLHVSRSATNADKCVCLSYGGGAAFFFAACGFFWFFLFPIKLSHCCLGEREKSAPVLCGFCVTVVWVVVVFFGVCVICGSADKGTDSALPSPHGASPPSALFHLSIPPFCDRDDRDDKGLRSHPASCGVLDSPLKL